MNSSNPAQSTPVDSGSSAAAPPELPVDLHPTFAEQFAHLAESRGDVTALIDATGELTFAELEARTNQVARLFEEHGVGQGDFVLISTAVGSVTMVSAIAAWKLGAVPMPVSDRLVQAELDAITALGRPALAVDTTDRRIDGPRLTSLDDASELSADPLPPAVAPQLKVPTSGGSTGRPKLIVSGAAAEPETIALLGHVMGVPQNGVCLVTAAVYHNASFSDALAALTLGNTTVLMERFDPELTLQMIEKHRAAWVYAVPTMMQRIWKLPDAVKSAYDLSSVETFFHVAAPCPQWLKRAWIDWLGPEVIYELYGPTEGQAATTITGTEWLEHPGSVGRAIVGEVSVRDDDGRVLPPGEIGVVWLRRGTGEPPAYRYLGAESEAIDEGWETVGDVGRLDEEGYLYLTDRRSDMLLVGGVNVYPAEIEAAVDRHPEVLASCCVGLSEFELGTVPALVIETADGRVPEDFDAFLSEQLSRVKRPRRVVATTRHLRDSVGKIRKREIKSEFLEDERNPSSRP